MFTEDRNKITILELLIYLDKDEPIWDKQAAWSSFLFPTVEFVLICYFNRSSSFVRVQKITWSPRLVLKMTMCILKVFSFLHEGDWFISFILYYS